MHIQVTASSLKPTAATADVLIIPVYSDGQLGKTLPEALRRGLGVHMRRVEFTGVWGTSIFLPFVKGSKAPFVALIGLGDRSHSVERHQEAMRRGVAQTVREARKYEMRSLVVNLYDNDTPGQLAAAAVEGAELANYRFTEYSTKLKKEQASQSIKKLSVVVPTAKLLETRAALSAVENVIDGVALARDLVNQPADAMRPEVLVAQARAIEAKSPHIKARIYDRREAELAGFNAFLAVARGSEVEPYVIHLTYTPKADSDSAVFLVGKGITFDSGGLSIKTGEGMEDMKIDMAGAAAVLGTFSVLEKAKPNVTVHGLIAACENMPSGTAYRPGDVLTAKNGKTIEVLNTDAEGRLTLADMLSFAVEHKPQAVIDLATLTGACVIALGETVAGLWGTDENLVNQIKMASAQSGEQACQLPMPEEYESLIQGSISDLINTSTAGKVGPATMAGEITAAMFLREFTGNTPWVHLDIAGPAHTMRPLLPYNPPGATGYGVRLLLEFLKSYGQ